jgi:hypothetical protein
MRSHPQLALLLTALCASMVDAAVVCKTKKGALVIRDPACRRRETPVNLAEFGAQGPAGPTGDPADVTRGALVSGADGTTPVVLDVAGFGQIAVQSCSTFPTTERVVLKYTNTTSRDQDTYASTVPSDDPLIPSTFAVAPANGVASIAFASSGLGLFAPSFWTLRAHGADGGSVTVTGFARVATGDRCHVSAHALISPP